LKNEESVSFSSALISFFIHSTEDDAVVREGVQRAIGIEESELQIRSLQGYYGNQIISVEVHLTGKSADQAALRIMATLDPRGKAQLISELGLRVDEHDSLFIRLDKESLVRYAKGDSETILLGEEESVRVKLKPKSRTPLKEEMLRKYRRFLS
jgi:RNA binding exosome subunit